MEDKERYNVGIITASIKDPFSRRLAHGAMTAAEKLNINLFVFPGKYLDDSLYSSNHENAYEYQYNSLFHYAAQAKLDYLIVATGTIAYSYDYIQKKNFLSMFRDTPVLSVAAVIDGYDSLSFDNMSGVIHAVNYLAREQGRKHIGIMAGNLNNSDCEERYEAYRYALKKNNLEYKDSYCMPCALNDHVTKETEQLILLNPELDAIICVNDNVALGVYEVLHKHNKHIGNDIAVVGFDDLSFSNRLEPPLASVKADAFKLGEVAVEKALNYLTGNRDNRHYIETEFIPRQSAYGQQNIHLLSDNFFDGSKEEIADSITAFFHKSGADSELNEDVREYTSELIKSIGYRFVLSKTDEDDLRYVINMVDILFTKITGVVSTMTRMQDIIDSGYTRLAEAAPPENIPYIRRLYNYFYKRLALDIASEYRMLEEKQELRLHYDYLFIRDTLTVSQNYHDNCEMLRRLSVIGACTSFLYLFKNPVTYHNKGEFPKDIELDFVGYAYGNDTFTLPTDEQSITVPEAFCNRHLNANRRHTMIAVDLFSAEFQYGIILCEPETFAFLDEIELVTYRISSIAKMMYILREQEKILLELNAKSTVLESSIKDDELTKVLNRWGFYEEAIKMVKKRENAGVTYIIGYADTDNLRKINEKYGREEGDYALKALAVCLKALFGSDAILGRMNSDEFAVIVPKEKIGEIADIQRKCNDIIMKLNSDSGKPYLITVSLGLVEEKCTDSYDINNFIDKASEKLYDSISTKKIVNEARRRTN